MVRHTLCVQTWCFSKVLSLDTPLHLCHPCTFQSSWQFYFAIDIPPGQHFCLQDEYFSDLGISRTQERRIMTGKMRRIKSWSLKLTMRCWVGGFKEARQGSRKGLRNKWEQRDGKRKCILVTELWERWDQMVWLRGQIKLFTSILSCVVSRARGSRKLLGSRVTSWAVIQQLSHVTLRGQPVSEKMVTPCWCSCEVAWKDHPGLVKCCSNSISLNKKINRVVSGNIN